MKPALVIAMFLILPVVTIAQMDANSAPQARPPAASAGPAAPGFPFPGGFNPPAGLFDQFWNDPAIAAELRLTDAQRKQLQAAALAQQLSLIDGGADGLKALARLSALLDADQLDDVAYKQQLNNLAAVAGKLVQDVGEMAAAAAPRSYPRAVAKTAKPAASQGSVLRSAKAGNATAAGRQ